MLFHLAFLLATILALTGAVPLPTTNSSLLPRTDYTRHGTGTIYNQFGAAGSCGVTHADSDLIAAIGKSWMQGGNNAPRYGRPMRATNVGSHSGTGGQGRSVEVIVADTCQNCREGDVDFSEGAWDALTGGAPWGNFDVEWYFL